MELLKPKQNKFLIALLQENTTLKAIESTGITPQTAYRYLADPNFKEALRQARRESVMMVSKQLSQSGERAVETLLEIATDSEAPASSRVSASRTLLEYLYRSFENDEIVSRIDKLEEQAYE